MKIGLLGGSFNPIHLGHLQIAESVLGKTDLQEIWFVPSGNHPLKNRSDFLDVQQRMSLIQKAIEDFPDYKLCTLDAENDKPSYTSELIKKIKKLYPQNQFCFIAGYDIVAELPLWNEYKWLLENIEFIIINRPNIDKSAWENLSYLYKLKFIEMPPNSVSSSLIRERIKQKKSIQGLVPEKIIKEVETFYKTL